MSEPDVPLIQPPLHVLLVEDSAADARIIEHTLKRGGIVGEIRRVDRGPDIEEALRGPLDVLLCDYSVPGLDALDTIALVRERRPDVPVIVVSGSIGEELAVGAMRAGAEDYLLKDRLERLALAVRQALERRRLERDRRRAEDTSRLLLRSVKATRQGVAIVDALRTNRPVVFANPAFSTITGFDEEEVLGRSLHELLGSAPALGAQLRSFLEVDRNAEIEVQAQRRDGTRYWCSLALEPIRDESKRTANIAVNCLDVTERRRLEEQFRRMQKMEALGQLAGGVAHDFNNLLFVVNAYAQQLLADPGLSPAVREAADAIQECGDRGTALTRQLLLFSRNEFVAPTRIDVNETMRDLDRMLRRLIRDDIALTASLDPDVGAVRLGTGMLERVITNLVLNARDAMPQGGTITVETRQVHLLEPVSTARGTIAPGRYVTVSVVDTGTGISKEVQERLFEPFFTTKAPDRGTGLGLATVYGMVSQAGGFVEVDSTVGRGSRFTIFLPELDELAEEPTEEETPADGAVARGRDRVLLVEDDARVRSVVAEMLTTIGYDVTVAENGTAALALADGGKHWAAMVTDVVMPGMNGRELADRMLRHDPTIALVLMSGYSDDPTVRANAERVGISHLQKPFSIKALAETLRASILARIAAEPSPL